MPGRSSLQNEEIIDLLKKANEAINKLEISIATPIVNVSPTPVTMEPTPVVMPDNITAEVSNLSELKTALEAVVEALQANKEVVVSNLKDIQPQPVSLKQIETLLSKLLEKDLQVTVKAAPPIVNVDSPVSDDPFKFIPVRLVDGNGRFYEAIGGGGARVGSNEPFADYVLYATIKNDNGYDYFGKENAEGAWAIQKRDRATGVFTWAVGKGNIDTNWVNRAALSFKKLSEV